MAAEDHIDMSHMHSDDVPSFESVPCHNKFRAEHPALENHGTVWTDAENQVLKNSVRKG